MASVHDSLFRGGAAKVLEATLGESGRVSLVNPSTGAETAVTAIVGAIRDGERNGPHGRDQAKTVTIRIARAGLATEPGLGWSLKLDGEVWPIRDVANSGAMLVVVCERRSAMERSRRDARGGT